MASEYYSRINKVINNNNLTNSKIGYTHTHTHIYIYIYVCVC